MAPRLNLDSIETYKSSVLRILEAQLKQYFGDLRKVSMEDIRKKVQEINEYPHLSSLRHPENAELKILDRGDPHLAERTVLSGKFFWEHTAAGEATRLGLGTKYLLLLNEFSIRRLQKLIIHEYVEDQTAKGIRKQKAESDAARNFTAEQILKTTTCQPSELTPISLGNRHMLQMAYDVIELAKKHGMNPKDVLAKQKMLVILNEQTADEILKEFEQYDYFGFGEDHVYFMVQESFHGIDVKNGKLFFDEENPHNKRLHNHGQMVMQKCHDRSIFVMKRDERNLLTFKEFLSVMGQMSDMLSYNIEDIGYLTESVDLPSLGFALGLGAEDYKMVMEVVAQNPSRPQKGGACFYDKILKRVVMVETNRLGGIKNQDIQYLNKNFNHYPDPTESLEVMKQEGIDLPFDVKHSTDKEDANKYYIYPCPIQGDLNFRLKCAYVMRKQLKPISNLKSPATIPPTIKAMRLQDLQEGFLELFDKVKEGL